MSDASSFQAGARVEYFSASIKHWIPAVVVDFDAEKGVYRLDIKSSAPAKNVRAGPNTDDTPCLPGAAASKPAPASFATGQAVQVWSVSKNSWVDAQVDSVEGETVRISYPVGPNQVAKKALPAGHKHLRQPLQAVQADVEPFDIPMPGLEASKGSVLETAQETPQDPKGPALETPQEPEAPAEVVDADTMNPLDLLLQASVDDGPVVKAAANNGGKDKAQKDAAPPAATSDMLTAIIEGHVALDVKNDQPAASPERNRSCSREQRRSRSRSHSRRKDKKDKKKKDKKEKSDRALERKERRALEAAGAATEHGAQDASKELDVVVLDVPESAAAALPVPAVPSTEADVPQGADAAEPTATSGAEPDPPWATRRRKRARNADAEPAPPLQFPSATATAEPAAPEKPLSARAVAAAFMGKAPPAPGGPLAPPNAVAPGLDPAVAAIMQGSQVPGPLQMPGFPLASSSAAAAPPPWRKASPSETAPTAAVAPPMFGIPGQPLPGIPPPLAPPMLGQAPGLTAMPQVFPFAATAPLGAMGIYGQGVPGMPTMAPMLGQAPGFPFSVPGMPAMPPLLGQAPAPWKR